MPKKKTILLVEDERFVALDQKKHLRECGYDVISASTGEKAVELVHTAPRFDLILMDINLGKGIDGTEAAREILRDHDIPIVFLSSHTGRDIVEKTEKITSYGYVVKDSGITVLDTSIKMALELHAAHTELKHKEKLLGESEEQYRNIFTNMIDGFAVHEIILDEAGSAIDYRFLAVNPAFERLTGLNKKQLIGRTVREVLPDTELFWIEKYGEVALNGTPLHFEHYTRALGRHYEVTAYRPAPLQFACTFADITERKKAEEDLRESEEQLRAVFETASIGMCQAVPETGRFLRVNRKMCEITGYSSAELLTMSISEITHPEDREKDRQAFQGVVKGKSPNYRLEKRYIRKDGTTVWVNINMTVVRDPAGKPVRTIAAIEDITDRRELAEKLFEEQERLRIIFNASPAGIILVDASGVIVHANEGMAKMFGCALDELIGSPNLSHIHADERALAGARMNQLIKGEIDHARGERHYIRNDGTDFWGYLSARRQSDEKGRLLTLIVIVQDITESKKAEDMIRSSLREKELLLKEIHHRVKNNLQVMSSLLNLQSQYLNDPKARDIFRESTNRVKTMALIHDRLYRSENLSSIHFPGYVKDLAQNLVSTYAPDRRIDLNIEIEPLSFDIETAIPLGLVLNELISNTLKHAFPGKIEGALRIGLYQEAANTILLVSDNGVGLPEDLDFMNTHSLGMQLVVTLVEQLEGTIELKREKGTEFRIAFKAGS